MTINKNSVEQINVALLDMDKKIKSAISNGTSASDFKNLEASVDNIKKTLNETKTGLEPGKTYNINISGNAATADKAKEAEKANKLVNALTVNGKTYDGSSAVDAGVQTIENGGTGATTAKEAFMSLANGLSDDVNPIDTEHIIFKNNTGTNWGLYTLSQFWEYIKGKISGVLGLTKDNYGGKSAKSSFLDEYVGAGGTRPTSGNLVPKDASEYGGMRKDVVTSSMTDSGRPGQDGHLLTMFWDSNGRWDTQLFLNCEEPPALKVRVKENEADYGPWVDLITSQNVGSQTVAKASTAGTADYSRNMYYQNLDLSELDKTKFYPLVCLSNTNFAEVAICSESGMDSMDYNQNRIHFDISTLGWFDTRPTLNIREYTCYENNEVTIGCIGRGLHNGAWAIWLRGGLHYVCFSRDSDLSLKTSDYTFGDETYTIGTNYYGGSNTNVGIMFTPQSTITEGAYSSRPITAPNITSLEQRVAALESKI